jgi:hypothetical protein
MVDAQEWNLPCHRQSFRSIQSRIQARTHARAASDGNKVWLLSDFPATPSLKKQYVREMWVGIFLNWQAAQRLTDEDSEILLMGFV